jgi:curved DNA-binding protein CbpA
MAATLYDVLGVAPDAPAEALRAAHRERARQLHPDRVTGDATAMRALNQAWAVLSDPEQRAAYDRSLAATGATDEEAAEDGDKTAPQVQVRMRLWPFLILAAGLLVVLTAYAGRSGDARTHGEPVGQCLVAGPDPDRTEPCRSAGGRRIVAVGGPGVQCPGGTDAHALRAGTEVRTVCVSRVAGR